MQEESAQPIPMASPEDEMRRLFAAKETAKEAERKRLSRKTTKIVVGSVLLVVAGILCMPLGWNPSQPGEGPNSELAAKAAQLQAQLSGGQGGQALVPSDGTPEGDARRSDAHFAMDLLRYVQPEKQGQATPVPAPEGK